MAHVKSGGVAKGNKDSQSQRLGLKKTCGQPVKAGNIIMRQRGTKYYPGEGTAMGKDYTIFAKIAGFVQFKRKKGQPLISIKA